MKSKLWNYQFVQYFLYLCIPLVLLLALVLWLLFRTQADATLVIMQANERQSLHLARRTIDTVLGVLRGDALFLAEHSSLQRWLDAGDSAAQSHLAADFLAFARRRQLYDQVRFLDEQGREVVRINLSGGQPMVTPPEQLQDQSERDYVRNALALEEETVLIAPFKLKINQGVIEQPVKPTIHLSVPVFDSNNQKRGLVVLDYRGQRLLNRLRAISEHGPGDLWLLNTKGYWLIGPRPEVEWGFMYPDRQILRFDHEFGEEVWLSIQRDTQSGQWMHEKGLFTYARVTPAESQNSTGSEHWFLVSQVSPSIIAASMADYVRNLIMAFILLTLLLLSLSGVIAYSVVGRREAERKVRASEAQFRKLLESAPDAIVITDRHGRITLVNAQTEKWFGYSRDELLGQSVEQLVPERFRKEYPIARERYAAEPATRPMRAGTELYGRHKDGSEFPVEISLSPLEADQGLLVTSIIRDISARKQAEEAQRRVQTRYHDLINNLPIGVFRNQPGAEGKFLEVNQAMVDIFEAESIEQLLPHPFSEFYCHLADRQAFIDKVTRQGYANGEEVRLRTLKGREFYAALTAVMKKDEAGEIYFDGTVEDISARKESECQIQQLNDSLRIRSKELETINRELEAFSYSVSHDLRAPLRAMDGFSRTLLEEYADRLDDKGRDRLRRIRAAAQRMAALIDDLLKLSRVSRTELKWETVNLTQLANEILDILRQEEPERAVQYQVQPDLVARGDTQLLRVMLDNLLSNAWKFTAHCPEALIQVGCKVREEKIVYFIRDNGAGFDMAYADKLFGAFQRLHDANEFPGTGIGLATVQRVIHKHGGRIWAESAVNQGASFYFTLDEKGNV